MLLNNVKVLRPKTTKIQKKMVSDMCIRLLENLIKRIKNIQWKTEEADW